MPHAFRCKNCGHLHTSEQAGEEKHPAACSACGHGVSFTRAGVKELHPDNWEHLCEASEERLAELGLTAEDVCKHEACCSAEASVQASVLARDELLAKKRRWEDEGERELIIAQVNELDAQADAATGDEAVRLRQQADDLANCEFTDRDAEALAVHAANISRKGVAPRKGGLYIGRGASDRSKAFDRGRAK